YSSKDIEEKFKLLVESHFLIRCPYPHSSENKSVPNLTIAEHELYIIPQIKLHLLETDNTGESEPKKQKIEFPDSGIYWRINYVRFNQYFRDEAIITACSNYFGEKEAEIVKTILMLADTKANALTLTTNAIPYYEILQRLTKTINMKSQELDSYLSTLCDGAESFVSKADDRSGGMYVVNIGKILSRLVQSIAISVIQDRFGSKCARVFRIILAKKALEPKQIEELAMLLPRDTKEFIYKLFEESFILAHDVAKGPDFSHGQAIYLLRVDMNQ
ncbi:DNA-directed RNA polymerase III subunit RPC3-like, partial [Stegodyphus dumicola]|uniref:DNA-directed RNA polymerase III subunit RPC3-like n=1 Tax=Stegodyphus dumicola TaxID=202533 RepID=UPI0015B2B0D8